MKRRACGEAGAFQSRRSGRAPHRKRVGFALAAISRRRGPSKSRRCDRRDGSTVGGRRSPAWLGAKASAGQGSLARRARPRRCRWRARCRGGSLVAVSEKAGSRQCAPRSVRCADVLGRRSRRALWAVRSRRASWAAGGRRGIEAEAAAIDGSSRASAVVGALRSIEGSAGCGSQSRRSGDHARSRRSHDFSGGVSLGRPDTSVCPLGFVASLSLADRPRNGGPRLFSADAGAVHFLTGASAGSLFLAPDIFASRSKKVGVSPSSALLRPAPPPDGRRTRVQARSLGQAFRDRTEGNKPASGRRNPRPRKSGSRS